MLPSMAFYKASHVEEVEKYEKFLQSQKVLCTNKENFSIGYLIFDT